MQETVIKLKNKRIPVLFKKGTFLYSENDETVYLVISKNQAVVVANPDDGLHCIGDIVREIDIDDSFELFFGDVKVIYVKDINEQK